MPKAMLRQLIGQNNWRLLHYQQEYAGQKVKPMMLVPAKFLAGLLNVYVIALYHNSAVDGLSLPVHSAVDFRGHVQNCLKTKN